MCLSPFGAPKTKYVPFDFYMRDEENPLLPFDVVLVIVGGVFVFLTRPAEALINACKLFAKKLYRPVPTEWWSPVQHR